MLTDKREDLLTGSLVVTGGTGSFGKVIVRRLLEGEVGLPAEVVVFSRSEATQHQMRLDFQNRRVATDEIVYEEERHSRLHFQIGDIRDPGSVVSLLRGTRHRLPRGGDEAGPGLRVQPLRGGEDERRRAPRTWSARSATTSWRSKR